MEQFVSCVYSSSVFQSTGSVWGNCSTLEQVLVLITWAKLGAGTQEVKLAEVKTGTQNARKSRSCY